MKRNELHSQFFLGRIAQKGDSYSSGMQFLADKQPMVNHRVIQEGVDRMGTFSYYSTLCAKRVTTRRIFRGDSISSTVRKDLLDSTTRVWIWCGQYTYQFCQLRPVKTKGVPYQPSDTKTKARMEGLETLLPRPDAAYLLLSLRKEEKRRFVEKAHCFYRGKGDPSVSLFQMQEVSERNKGEQIDT